MEFNRQEIKGNAKAALHANYWPIVGYSLLAFIIVGAVSGLSAVPFIGYVVSIVLVPIFDVSYQWFFYKIYEGEEPDIKSLFDPFKDNKFGHVLGGWWYMNLFIFLWSLLFVIPGIIKSIAYSMTPYILMDQPEISATDALKKSMEMTKGHKWEIFVMYLSFLGWDILTCLTAGILGIFYVIPYQQTAMAGIYDCLKRMNGDADVVDATANTTVEYEYVEAKTTAEEVEAVVEAETPFEEE